jgi:O-antigen ligase
MKKLIPYFCFLFLMGIIIPFVYGQFPKAFIYVLIVFILALVILLIKKGKVTVYDCLIIYMGLIPLHTFRVGTESVFLRLTEIAFIPLFLWWIVHRRQTGGFQSLRRFKKVYVVLFFFMLFSFMSVAKSIRPGVSIYRNVILIYLIFLSFMVADIFRTTEKMISVIKPMLIIGALTGVIAMLQSFFPILYPFPSRVLISNSLITIIRSGVGWDDPSYYGLYIAMILPITLSCLLSGKFREKSFLKICLLLQIGGLVSSYSRLSLGGFFVSSVYLLWVHKRKNIAVSIVLLVILFLGSISLARPYVYEKYPYIAAYFFRIPDEETLQDDPKLVAGYRYDCWRANINMFVDNPWLGVGPFMSTDRYLDYRPSDALIYDIPLAVHSEYLSMLSERGALGFGSFALFIVVLFSHAAGNISTYSDTQCSVLIAGLKAGMISWLIFSFGGASVYSIQFWISVGMLLALFDINKLENGIKGSTQYSSP